MQIKNQLVIASLIAGIASSSYAQFGGSGGMGGMGGMRQSRNAGVQNDNAGRPASRLEQFNSKLYDLRIRLLITPGQSAVWETFRTRFIEAATARPQAVSALEEQSALQSMQRQLGIAQDRFTLMESLYEAHKLLFAALAPDQQRTADQSMPQLLAELGTGAESGASSRLNIR